VALGASILDPDDPGLYRNQSGRMGADLLMAPDVGFGGRYVITTNEAHAVNGATAALPNDWRRILDPHGHSFAVLVLGVILFIILAHLRVGGTVEAGLRAGVGK
jgi:hypothetical protein